MKAAILLILSACVGLAVFVLGPNATRSSAVLIEGAHVRPVADGAVVLMTFQNTGIPDRLISASSPRFEANLYSPESETGLPIPSGTSSLALDGAHVTLSLKTEHVDDGQLIPITLTFENAGNVSLKARLFDPAGVAAVTDKGLFGYGDVCVVEDGEPAPKVDILLQSGESGLVVNIASDEFTFSRELLGLYHVPGQGHGHIYVGGVKIGRIFEPTVTLGALPPGNHIIRVTLNTNDHRAYVVDGVPVTATATIVVD